MTAEQLDASIVLPTYNEAQNLPVIIPQICKTLKEVGINGEVIVVDDNSPDKTGEVAERLSDEHPVRILVRTDERGLATAVIAGFNISEARVCAVMDADGSHPVEKLPEMIRPLLDDKADITVGSRNVTEGGLEGWPIHRKLISKTASLMSIGLTKLSDPTSGFMAIKRPLLTGLKLNPVGWKIVLETVVKTETDRVLEIPITFKDREFGESKMSATEQWNYIKHLYLLHKYKRPSFIEFIKFCIVGFSGVFIDMGVFTLVKEVFTLDTRLCAVFGFMVAVTTNYIFNRYWSFERGRETSFIKSYLSFVAVCSVGLLVRIGVMHTLIEVYPPIDRIKILQYLNNLIGIVVATIVNFIGTKLFAFSPERFAFQGNPCERVTKGEVSLNRKSDNERQ